MHTVPALEVETVIAEHLGVQRSAIDLYDVYLSEQAWLTASVVRDTAQSSEIGPMTSARAMQSMATAAQMSVMSSQLYAGEANCIIRKCRQARRYTERLAIPDREFVVKAKIVEPRPEQKEFLSVYARIENKKGQLFFSAIFECQLVAESSPFSVPDAMARVKSKLFSRAGQHTQASDISPGFKAETIFDLQMDNFKGSAKINHSHRVLQQDYSAFKYYPMPFVADALSTIAARMVAGRAGKRYFSYCVRHFDLHNHILVEKSTPLELECLYHQKVDDWEKLHCWALAGPRVCVELNIGIKVFDGVSVS